MSHDSRYRASKDLYEMMERHDRGFMRFILGIIIIVLIIVISALSWAFL